MCLVKWSRTSLAILLGLSCLLRSPDAVCHGGWGSEFVSRAGNAVSNTGKKAGKAISDGAKKAGSAVSKRGKHAKSSGLQLGTTVPVVRMGTVNKAGSQAMQKASGGIRPPKVPLPTSLPTKPGIQPLRQLPNPPHGTPGLRLPQPESLTTGGKPWLPQPTVKLPKPAGGKSFVSPTQLPPNMRPPFKGAGVGNTPYPHAALSEKTHFIQFHRAPKFGA